jgi:hypothetical protein
MTEAQLQTKFGHYLQALKLKGHYELKYVRSGGLGYSKVEDHQHAFLSSCHEGYYHKYSDIDVRKKGADCSYTEEVGYLVVFYPYEKKVMGYIIPYNSIDIKKWKKTPLSKENADFLSVKKVLF